MLEKTIRDIAKKAREASFYLANVSTDKKNKALNIAAQLINERREEISEVNREDVREAERKGVSKAFIDRLTLFLTNHSSYNFCSFYIRIACLVHIFITYQ